VIFPHMHIIHLNQIHPLYYFFLSLSCQPSFILYFLMCFTVLFSYIHIMYFGHIHPPSSPSPFCLSPTLKNKCMSKYWLTIMTCCSGILSAKGSSSCWQVYQLKECETYSRRKRQIGEPKCQEWF
jgi:hypothetical protein